MLVYLLEKLIFYNAIIVLEIKLDSFVPLWIGPKIVPWWTPTATPTIMKVNHMASQVTGNNEHCAGNKEVWNKVNRSVACIVCASPKSRLHAASFKRFSNWIQFQTMFMTDERTFCLCCWRWLIDVYTCQNRTSMYSIYQKNWPTPC